MKYDYKCIECGYTEEYDFPMSEKPRKVKCNACGGVAKSAITGGSDISIKTKTRLGDWWEKTHGRPLGESGK